jgi:hypothetical protein
MSTIVDPDLIHVEPTDEQKVISRNTVVQALTKENVVLQLNAFSTQAVVIASVYYHIKAVCQQLAEVQERLRQRGVEDCRVEDCIQSFPVRLPVGLCGWVSQKTWQTVSSTHLA